MPRHHQFKTPSSHHIAYVEWGDSTNKKVVFCVHGLTRNGRDFDHLAKALLPHYRVICPDVAGRGKSDWLEDKTRYNYGTYVADMLGLIEALGVKQVDWVGTSMGGLIGMTIAAFHPGLIRSLVLNDIGPFVPGIALRRIGKYVGLAPLFGTEQEAESHMRMIFAPFGIASDEDWRHMVQHGVQPVEGGKLRLAYDPAIAEVFSAKDIQDMDLWALWDAIQARVLVLRGETSDILPEEIARKMQQRGPKARLVQFAGVGHAPALMELSQIEVVKNWLLEA